MGNKRIVCLAVALLILGKNMPVPSGAATPRASVDGAIGRAESSSKLPTSIALSPGRGRKLQRWTGSLVDAICMADALRRVPSVDAMVFLEPLAQYYSHPSADSSDAQGPGAAPVQAQAPAPNQPNQSPLLDSDQGSELELQMQAAELRRASLIDEQVRLCIPKPPSQHFGLMIAGGDLLNFDTVGDFKATQALRTRVTQPGGILKAVVRGIWDKEDTITVASIEIKGRFRFSDPG